MTPTFRVVYQAKSLAEFRELMAEYPTLAQAQPPIANATPGMSHVTALIPKGEKGEGEKALMTCIGKEQVRFSPQMVAMFGLNGTREEMCIKFLSLLQSGQVVRTVLGYKWANEGQAASASSHENSCHAIGEIDPDSVV